MSRHLKEIWSQVDWVCHLKPRLPECELAAVLHQSQRCVSDGYSWDTGRRSCFAPDREPAGTSATQEIKEEKSWPPVGEMWKGKEILGHCTGTLTFLNISAPLRASNRAMSCGVETITAPGKGTYTEVHKTWGEKKVWPELFDNKVCGATIFPWPATGTFWVMDNWTSPVPGGMSTTR